MAGFGYNSFVKFLLILLPLILGITSITATRVITPQSSLEFIKTSCSSTTYPNLCYSSLSTQAIKIQTSPKLLATAALNVTLSSAKSTTLVLINLSHMRGRSPREAGAMRDCMEELSDSVDKIRKSIEEVGHAKASNIQLMVNDVQTWISAALTDESTCSDGFAGKVMNGKVKDAVRTRIVNLAHLTSNALALVSNYATVLH